MPVVVVQIPCLNEAETLPAVLREIPRAIPGADRVLVLVIDDGSTDGTARIALDNGADRVIRFPRNRGLAAAFTTGLEAALEMGADVIVNTDGDGQYPGDAIPALVRPVLEGGADLVIGDRDPGALAHFSPLKRFLQRAGNRVMRWATSSDVRDAASGFRAFSRRAALRLNVLGEFTYTMETLVQAGWKKLVVESVPIRAREVRRPSRLFRSIPHYLLRTGTSILRVTMMYRPLPVFLKLGSVFLIGALLISLRFLWYWLHGGGGKVQSLILASILSVIGVVTLLLALLADLIAANRRLLEEILFTLRGSAARGAAEPGPGARAGAEPARAAPARPQIETR